MTGAAPGRPAARRSWRFGTRGLLVLVAGLAAVLAAGRYRRDHLDPDRAMYTARRDDLASPEAARRVEAARALGEPPAGFAGRAIVALTGALNDSDPKVRAAAADSLTVLFKFRHHAMGAKVDADVPRVSAALTRHLDDPDAAVRRDAIRGLIFLALRDPDPSDRVTGLGEKVGLDMAHLVPALEAGLHDPNEGVRDSALEALADLLPGTEARRRLVAVLQSESPPSQRARAIQLLRRTGDGWADDPEVARPVARALDDPHGGLRSSARQALSWATDLPPDVTADLLRRLRERDDEAAQDEGVHAVFDRRGLARILTQTTTDEAILRPLLRDGDPFIRSITRGALGLPDAADPETDPEETGGAPGPLNGGGGVP